MIKPMLFPSRSLSVDQQRLPGGCRDVLDDIKLLCRSLAELPTTRADALEIHIAALIRTFDALVVAADQFRTDCRASHLRTLKTLAISLLDESAALDHAM